MTQSMGVNTLLDTSLPCEPGQQVPDVALVDLGSGESAENRSPSLDLPPLPCLDQADNQSASTSIDADDPSPVAFPCCTTSVPLAVSLAR